MRNQYLMPALFSLFRYPSSTFFLTGYAFTLAFLLVIPVSVQASTIHESSSIEADPITIAEARTMPEESIVTVTGWVTVAEEFSGPVYFQDETGGLAVYDAGVMRSGGFNLDVSFGDSIVVQGPLSSFNSMLQISPVTEVMDEIIIEVYPEGRRDIQPRSITIGALNTGHYESQLVTLHNVYFQNTGTFSANSNYDIMDGTEDTEIRISSFTDLPGMAIPSSPVHITGVASRFWQTIQLFPRSRLDITTAGSAPQVITAAPYEISATSESITFYWETEQAGIGGICYGKTDDLEQGCTTLPDEQTEHLFHLESLEPATTYSVQVISIADEDTTFTLPYYVSTRSPAESSQEINTYFSQSVDHNLAWPSANRAEANVNFADHYTRRIYEAQSSVDAIFYSFSGAMGEQIATALAMAHGRGVQVRVIICHTTSTNAVEAILNAYDVPFIESDFGVLNQNRNGLQHNKFAVIDYASNDPSNTWLITSSWNATDNGTHQQYQNMIEFQDEAIAGAYSREFNQMWGSNTHQPDPEKARFGSNKRVVNPSVFWIGDSYVRLFFSPQGNTETAIINAIQESEESINVNTMLITRPGIEQALKDKFDEGLTVRGLIGNPNVTGSQFSSMSSWGDFIHFSESEHGGLLHHKLAIFDGENRHTEGRVLTGSHNWSRAANESNDENTLLITNQAIANQYIQEFSARYQQAGGQNLITITSAEDTPEHVPESFQLEQNYPNPFNPSTTLRFYLPDAAYVNIHVYDLLGRKVDILANHEFFSRGRHSLTYDASSLAGGVYFYRVQLDNGDVLGRTMTLIK
ncbi:phospholipase D-like domain-containing protein [Balneolaceae bacterium ANBcel3]|nr:phospholipase D-like domain-containing protein [Balneolaceae bacterium ANBcel3]